MKKNKKTSTSSIKSEDEDWRAQLRCWRETLEANLVACWACSVRRRGEPRNSYFYFYFYFFKFLADTLCFVYAIRRHVFGNFQNDPLRIQFVSIWPWLLFLVQLRPWLLILIKVLHFIILMCQKLISIYIFC